MLLTTDVYFTDFDGFDGSEEVVRKIHQSGKDADFEYFIGKAYPDGILEEELNELLLQEGEKILSMLGIRKEEQKE